MARREYVRPYQRKNGSYVSGHWRTISPNRVTGAFGPCPPGYRGCLIISAMMCCTPLFPIAILFAGFFSLVWTIDNLAKVATHAGDSAREWAKNVRKEKKTPVRIYTCPNCNKSFKTLLESMDEESELYRCPACKWGAPKKNDFRSKLINRSEEANGVRRYYCSKCNTSFEKFSVIVNARGRLYRCPVCK